MDDRTVVFRMDSLPFKLDLTQLSPEVRKLLTMTGNGSDDVPMGDAPSMEMMLLHHAFIICLTLLGNALLVFVILRNNQVVRRKRVTPVQMLMLHMCAADVLFALITVLPTMAITWTVPYFYGPDLLCKVVKFLQVFPMYASSFLLVAISADRYMAICRPLASMRSSSAYNRPAFYAAVAWSMAFLLSTPQLALFQKRDGDCVGTYTSPYQYTAYVIVFNTVVWLLPSAIAGYLYYCVCKAVWQSTAGSSSWRARRGDLLQQKQSGMKLHHKGSTLQCVELDRRRVQTVKLTLTVVAATFLLWAPFCITSVVDALWPQAINPTFATYIMFFGNLNSCMNPWIWFHFNRNQLRRALPCVAGHERQLLRCRQDVSIVLSSTIGHTPPPSRTPAMSLRYRSPGRSSSSSMASDSSHKHGLLLTCSTSLLRWIESIISH